MNYLPHDPVGAFAQPLGNFIFVCDVLVDYPQFVGRLGVQNSSGRANGAIAGMLGCQFFSPPPKKNP